MKRRRAPWPYTDLMYPILSFLGGLDRQRVGLVSKDLHQSTAKLRARSLLSDLQGLFATLGTPLPQPWPAEVYLSGSVLWRTMVPGPWLPNDVDLFLPNDPAVIRATQQWLVNAGYRILKGTEVRKYGSLIIQGVITWIRPLDPPAIPLQMIIVDTERRRPGEPESTFRSRLIRFDLRALENTWNGREVQVGYPAEVLAQTTRVEPLLNTTYWFRERRVRRLKCYRSRGLQWQPMCAHCERDVRDGSPRSVAPRCLCPPR